MERFILRKPRSLLPYIQNKYLHLLKPVHDWNMCTRGRKAKRWANPTSEEIRRVTCVFIKGGDQEFNNS